MMIGQFIFSVFLYISFDEVQCATEAPSSTGPKTANAGVSGLSGNYVASVSGPADTVIVTSQDIEDAEAIMNSKMQESIIASIFPYRSRDRLSVINQQIGFLNGGAVLIDDKYIPLSANSPFKDLCYSMIQDKLAALSGYLTNFFHRRDETMITIALVLADQMEDLKKTYDTNHNPHFENRRKHQRHPYRNMLWVWCEKNREADEIGPLNTNDIKKDTDALKKEEKGSWYEDRDQIELILMKKSKKYARAVITEFEKVYQGLLIENVIYDDMRMYSLHDLADAYSSLARYIKNIHQYKADILRTYSDGSEQWAVWNMCIAVTTPEDWPKIDEAFKKNDKDDSLSKFIVQKLTSDKVMAEMIAAIVDPNFKPTLFSKAELELNKSPPQPPPSNTIPSTGAS